MGDTVYYRVSDEPNGEMQVLSVSVTGLADYLSGDADQNGVVDGRDVTAIRRYLEGLPTVCHTGAADLDDSGSVDARDVEILRQYLVENN
ncbi:MAG: dockerin type I repeat-containing protein, partial [Clostridia bacterium]|nr:dockerin type I repeat-containing protein [Clostridia bacterium]